MTGYVVIALAAFVAGAINSIAGGGTLISFPALMYIGVSPVMANATNTVAIWPGSFAGVLGFREDIKKLQRWLLWLMIPSLLGGITGAMILLRTPEKTFARIVPLLILGATLLLAAQEVISRRLNRFMSSHEKTSRGWILFAFTFQFFVSVYGGYFGAGMGILMLAALGLIGMQDLHQMNGLKNLLAICINGVAAIYFAMHGAVVWADVVVMAVASILGGFAGARLAHRLGRKFVRGAVVVIGLTMTIVLFLKH
ncbi:MAG TPA: sulfite exporter TauE/SafE family protein [Thermoanaerobaculia bacterium]|nr:sulfite exporter TauE/SafE family protein [Thermoanaerobaculia bacterium]